MKANERRGPVCGRYNSLFLVHSAHRCAGGGYDREAASAEPTIAGNLLLTIYEHYNK
jgi:hypothetical protein